MALSLRREPVGTHHGIAALQDGSHVFLAHQLDHHHGAVVALHDDVHRRFKRVCPPLLCNLSNGHAHKFRGGTLVDQDLVPAGRKIEVFKHSALSLEIPDHLRPKLRRPQAAQ